MKWRFIYRGIKARYRDQRPELIALTESLLPNQIAIDVGANKGSYLWSLSRALPKGRVFAFEPQPILAKYLEEACPAAGLNNVKIIEAGCSRNTGALMLAIPGKKDSSPGASFEKAIALREECRFMKVKTFSLDDYFSSERSKIKALKIDVEGHELSTLIGATQLIKKNKPTIVCECEQRHITSGSVKDVFDFILSMNYEGYFSDHKSLRSLSEFRLEKHQQQTGERYWDAPNYFNNFIFKPI